MATAPTAFLVARRDDGFGDVHPLAAGYRYTLGRAPGNRVVLKDDMCSREHAEVFQADGKWYARDLGSLNGSKVNGQPLHQDWPLKPGDELHVGRTRLLFVEDVSQLPPMPARPPAPEDPDELEIKQRLAQTTFLPPVDPVTPPPAKPAERRSAVTKPASKPTPTPRELALGRLYRLAVAMGATQTVEELVEAVLAGLLEAIPADVGAVLAVRDRRDPELLAWRHRDPNARSYHKVSQFVSNEVLASKEAVLATNVADDRHLRNRESLSELHVSSLICAPALHEGNCLGLVHLYSTTAGRTLSADDLEFALAIARQFGAALHQLRRQAELAQENQSLRAQLRVETELVGSSSGLRAVESQIGRVAETSATVLVRGESGVGKELVARAVHRNSKRKDGPFVCLNCAALTETLLESELFGHEKGAFTGATERMAGKFESAHRGTLFLDEIGEMNLNTQAKLLRVLEGHPFERVGGNTPIHADVRLLAATNKPLEEAVRAGTFRKDLFYRLQVVEIRVPPLRDRPGDVPALAEHFLKRFSREMGRKITGFTPSAMAKLQGHPWPGNVRELRNAVERAVALGAGPLLDANDVWLSTLDLDASPVTPPVYEPVSLEEVEVRHILATLTHTDWNKSRTAEILGIERSTLDRKIKAHDLRR